MSPEDEHRLGARAQVLKALAHPARLFLVERLSDGSSLRVQELAGYLDLDLSTVSRHLARLKEAGVLSSERRGNEVLYSLRVPCLQQLFGCIEAVLEARAESTRRVLACPSRDS